MCFHSHPAAFPPSKSQISLCHLFFSLSHTSLAFAYVWYFVCTLLILPHPPQSFDFLLDLCLVFYSSLFSNTQSFAVMSYYWDLMQRYWKQIPRSVIFSENKLLLSLKPKDYCREVCYIIVEVDAYACLLKWKCREVHFTLLCLFLYIRQNTLCL